MNCWRTGYCMLYVYIFTKTLEENVIVITWIDNCECEAFGTAVKKSRSRCRSHFGRGRRGKQSIGNNATGEYHNRYSFNFQISCFYNALFLFFFRIKFKDDLDLLNSIARDKSNAQMIHQINQENPQLREMHTENMRLRVSLEDHQRALEHIMSKYREHTQLALKNSKLNLQELFKGETEKSMVCAVFLFVFFQFFYLVFFIWNLFIRNFFIRIL